MRPGVKKTVLILAVFWACVVIAAAITLRITSRSHASPTSVNVESRPEKTTQPSDARPTARPVTPSPPPDPVAPEPTSSVTDADIKYIADRKLLIPVAGINASQLHDTFSQSRSEGRRHDAIDIIAPQGAAVLAATDGSVLKLFRSDRGGITLYELDPSGKYVYYYAHLMGYADGVNEGKQLRRGEVIGYVGDTGNAAPGQFHLHFAISKTDSPRKWSRGDPINPFPLLTR